MNRAYVRAIRAFRAEVVYYLIAWFLVQFCFSGIYAVLMNLYVLRLGYGPVFMGTVQATMGLGFAAFALVGGAVGTRIGHRRAIILGLSCNVLFSAVIPLSVFVSGTAQRILIVLPYGLYGLCLTFIIVNGVAFLANSSDKENRSVVFSIYSAIPPLAGFTGSLVAGFLPNAIAGTTAMGMQHPEVYGFSLWIVTLLYAFILIIFLRSRETKAKQTSQPVARSAAPVTAMAVMLIVEFFRSLLLFALTVFFNAYLDSTFRVATPLIGGLMSVARLIAAPAALLAPMIIGRLGCRKSVLVAGLIAAVSVLPAALVGGVWFAAFSLIAVVAIGTIFSTAFTIFHQEITHPQWRSIMSGAVFTAGGLSYAAVGYGGGAIIDLTGYQSFFLLSMFISLCGIVVFWLFFTAGRTEKLTSAATG